MAIRDPWLESTITVTASDIGTEVEVDVTDLVNFWRSIPGLNFGIALRHIGETNATLAGEVEN